MRSEGNAFFTEELLAADKAGTGELPVTLRDLLRGRVEALPERAQQVLAVAGRQVPHRLLASVAGLDDQDLAEALRVVVAHQLLVTRPGEEGYQVRHALLREVIDADLLPGERARLHAALAQTLTDQPELADGPPAATAAELAAHWDAAGEPTRALPARVQAGLAAERAHAFPRPKATTSVPSSCGSRSPTRAGRPGWTRPSCWPGRPTPRRPRVEASVRWRC